MEKRSIRLELRKKICSKYSKRIDMQSKLFSKPRKIPLERRLWKRKATEDRDCNVCVAAMVVARAISPEEGEMEFKEAKTFVYERTSRDVMKAFMVISKELMDELYNRPRDMCAADEAVDDPEHVSPDSWIGSRVPMWKNIWVSVNAWDSSVDIYSVFVSNTKRRLVRNILVDVMKRKFPLLDLRDEPNAANADTPPESVQQSQHFQSCNSQAPGSNPSRGGTDDFRSYGSSDGQGSARLGRADAGASDQGSVVSSTRPAVQLRSREALHSDSLELAQQQAIEAASLMEARTRKPEVWDPKAWKRSDPHAPTSKGRGRRRASGDYDQGGPSWNSESHSGQNWSDSRWHRNSRAGSAWSDTDSARDRERTRDSRSDCQSFSSKRW